MVEANKASELLAKMRAAAGLKEPEIKPLEKALAKKDEPEEKEVEYVWGYIKQLSTGGYVGGAHYDAEGGMFITPDYREATYLKVEKGVDLNYETFLDAEIAHFNLDPELGYDDFMFVEATITLKG